MRPLVIIPARGGSKGVPGKNIKLLNGKPLILYSIEAARELFSDDIICVSTDNEDIKSVAESAGLNVPFIRPTELATDTAGSYEVLIHALNYYESEGYIPDTVIILQPTSPFRKSLHIQESMALYDNQCEMVVSVKISKSNPYYTLREEDENGWLVKSKTGDFTRRQDCPIVYEVNGAVYIVNVNSLKTKPLIKFSNVRKYLMDEFCSHDIDTPLDWEIAEFICKEGY
ncbi:MAG: acylneuraminate cytidylyltransferase family protein [Bacteroidetes bacterium]|nr:acylneuraminate cytidylyltransferase family protein [Bacteroidota bacterium]